MLGRTGFQSTSSSPRVTLIAFLLALASTVSFSCSDQGVERSAGTAGRRRFPAGPRPVRGWPVILGNAISHEPAVADIDADGRDEIAVSTRDCRIFLLAGDGSILPGWPRETKARINRGPMLEDVSGDGEHEVAAVSMDGLLHMWEEDGSPVRGWPVDLGDVSVSAPIPVRFPSGEFSILVSCRGGSIHLLSPEGESMRGWPVKLPYMTTRFASDRHPTAQADLDGDGSPEILHLSSRRAFLHAWTLDGTLMEGFPIDLGEYAGLGMAVDDAASPSRIACTTRDTLHLLDTSGRRIAALPAHDAGDEFFFAPYFISSGESQGAGADLLMTGTMKGLVQLWSSDGEPIRGWPIRLNGFIYGIPTEDERHWFHGPPLSFDVDGDGVNEIIIGSYDHHLYCFDLEGRLMPGWPVVVDDFILGALTTAQFDGIGSRELLLGQYGEALFAYHLDQSDSGPDEEARSLSSAATYSEWPPRYYAVSIVVILMVVLLIHLIRTMLAGLRITTSRTVLWTLPLLILLLVARIVLLAGDLRRYGKAKELLAEAEDTVGRVLEEERERVAFMADQLETGLDTCAYCDLENPLRALRHLERLADHHRLEFRFNGLLLARPSGEIIQGVGLARGWTHLSELGLDEDGREDPILVEDTPVFAVESSRILTAGTDTLRLYLMSSLLNNVPNAVADASGFSANIQVDGRTLAWGGTAARPYRGISPWLGIVQPSRLIMLPAMSSRSRISILLTMERFEKPLTQWLDLAAVLLLPCIYLLIAARRKHPGTSRLGWWWIIAFGILYIAGTLILHHGLLSSGPVTASGRMLEVFLHSVGITGIVAALHRGIVSRRSRQLNFALLASYLVVSLIPLSVIILVGLNLFQRMQNKIVEDTFSGLETRAENMVLAYMGSMVFNSSLTGNMEHLLDGSAETSWLNFVSDSQYLFNYDLPTAYMTLWARDMNDPRRFFTGYSYRAPRTGKLYYTRPPWTGDSGVKGLFLDNGTAVIRAMKSFRVGHLEAQLVSHIPIDRKILHDIEQRMRILPFMPHVQLEPAWLESVPVSGRRAGWYIPYGSELVIQGRDWSTGVPRWIMYRAGFYLQGAGEIWRIILPGILIIMLPLGLSVWGAYTTFRWTARPLKRLLDGIRRVGEGDLGYRLRVTGQSEIGLAARSFDSMAESLRETVSELAEKQKVEEVSEMKSRFISMVSHDLKTPLSSIKGATENILEELAGPVTERQRTYLEMILKSSSNLQGMIADILDLSRIESGHIALNIEKIDVEHELDDLQRSMRPLLDRKGIDCRIVSRSSGTIVRADRTRLWQILNNILANAVAHSPEGGAIEIVLDDMQVDETEGRPMLRIAIADQGSGVREDERSRLFEPFYSRPSAATGKRGVGLGLAIVKQLVELHEGRVSISNSPRGGAVVTFTIPAD